MLAQIVRKLLAMIPIMLLVSIVLFTIINLLPGDPALAVAGEAFRDEALVAKIREDLGLNKPLYQRYWDWLSGVLRGDLGRSLKSNQPVIEIVRERLPVTLGLTLLAMVISTIIAVPLGIYAALHRNSASDVINSVVSMVGVALPNFWLAILLILLFSITLGWLPSSGYTAFGDNPLQWLRHMLLPAFSIGFSFAATITRQTRSSMLEVFGQDYILTARSKGLRERVVIWRHALRNALIPVVTVISMQMGRLIGGAVVTETVFALPGIGRELVDAISQRNYNVVMALILITALCVVVVNTLMDILYIVIDPRISTAKG